MVDRSILRCPAKSLRSASTVPDAYALFPLYPITSALGLSETCLFCVSCCTKVNGVSRTCCAFVASLIGCAKDLTAFVSDDRCDISWAVEIFGIADILATTSTTRPLSGSVCVFCCAFITCALSCAAITCVFGVCNRIKRLVCSARVNAEGLCLRIGDDQRTT